MTETRQSHLIIFTDLDGTLLDERYSFSKALPALRLLRARNIPLIICSSKTRNEIEACRTALGNRHPFISENGGGIFIPTDYFPFEVHLSGCSIERHGDYHVIRLGASYHDLREAMACLRSKGYAVKGFGDMSVREVSRLTGLRRDDAVRARQREFDEPFVFEGVKRRISGLKRQITMMGFHYTEGEFFHILGNSDKGRAVEILKNLYQRHLKKTVSVALGDSPNDIEMLQRADHAFVVRNKTGHHHPEVLRRVKRAVRIDAIGPEGWNRAIERVLKETDMDAEIT